MLLRKLLQKSHVPLEEQLQIVKSILQHRNSVYAHAECEAENFLGIVAVIFHKLKDVRINHATAENLDPSRLLARPTRTAFTLSASDTDEARDKHLRARLSEREKRRTKAGLHIGAE